MKARTLSLVLLFAVVSGCASGRTLITSKWAMDDEKYARQYAKPYSQRPIRMWTRMTEEMSDARFQEGKGGAYVGAGVAPISPHHPVAAGDEMGLFGLPTSWSTVRIGVIGLLDSGLPNSLTGAVVGAKFHLPTRLSPYVGISGMVGYAKTSTTATDIYVDGNGHLVMPGQTVPGPSTSMVAIIRKRECRTGSTAISA